VPEHTHFPCNKQTVSEGDMEGILFVFSYFTVYSQVSDVKSCNILQLVKFPAVSTKNGHFLEHSVLVKSGFILSVNFKSN